jgi:hypothetical protein
MVKRHRRDDNEQAVVDALERIGCTVFKIGRPVDLLVGFRAKNWLLEVKNKNGRDKLTEFQQDWIPAWRGQVRIVHTPQEAVDLVTGGYGGDR